MLALCAAADVSAAPARIDVKAGESLAAVRDKARAIPAAERKDGVEIVLSAGDYILPQGMEFTAQDGAVPGAAPVVWRAEKPGEARIMGSMRVPAASFAKVSDPALLARLPEEGRGKVYAADVSALCPGKVPDLPIAFGGIMPPPAVFINGRIASIASYPNGGEWLEFTKRVDQGTPVPRAKERFTGGAFVYKDSRPGRWDFSKGVWLVGYFTHDWYIWSVKAVSWGEENGTNNVMRIDPAASVPYGIASGTWGRKMRRFRAFNLVEELDAPCEWWLDRERKILYVVPPDGEMKDDVDIRLALSKEPVVRGKGVAGLRFEGLEFSCSYGRFAQFGDATNVVFSGCRFIGTAHGAVALSGMSNAVVRCEIEQCGAGGVTLSGGDRRTLVESGSRVEGCRIHDFGILQRTYASGVSMHGCGLALRGCEIFNAPHMAVGFGGNEMIMESNDVHHVVMETGDAGAFYTGRDWTTQGNVLRYNFVHDIGKGTTRKDGDVAAVSGVNAMGFYFDDCDCGDEIYGNVFMNCPRAILIGGGRDHPVRNNVFINCNLGLSIDCRGWRWKKKWNVPGGGWHLEGKAEKMDYRHGVWAQRYPRLANIMNDHPREPLYNPVEDNVFIDCLEIIHVGEIFKLDDNGTAPGLASRMAPIRRNTVIYTKGGKDAARRPLEPRIADGFRVLGIEN